MPAWEIPSSSSSSDSDSEEPVAKRGRGRPATVGSDAWLRANGLSRRVPPPTAPKASAPVEDVLANILRSCGGEHASFVAKLVAETGVQTPSAEVADLVHRLLGPDADCLVKTSEAALRAKLDRRTFRRRLEMLSAAIWYGTRSIASSIFSKHLTWADLGRIEIVAVFRSTAYDETPLKFKDPSKFATRAWRHIRRLHL